MIKNDLCKLISGRVIPQGLKDKRFASTSWSIEDVLELKPNWTINQCKEFLETNSHKIVAAMVEEGWYVIKILLEEEE